MNPDSYTEVRFCKESATCGGCFTLYRACKMVLICEFRMENHALWEEFCDANRKKLVICGLLKCRRKTICACLHVYLQFRIRNIINKQNEVKSFIKSLLSSFFCNVLHVLLNKLKSIWFSILGLIMTANACNTTKCGVGVFYRYYLVISKKNGNVILLYLCFLVEQISLPTCPSLSFPMFFGCLYSCRLFVQWKFRHLYAPCEEISVFFVWLHRYNYVVVAMP